MRALVKALWALALIVSCFQPRLAWAGLAIELKEDGTAKPLDLQQQKKPERPDAELTIAPEPPAVAMTEEEIVAEFRDVLDRLYLRANEELPGLFVPLMQGEETRQQDTAHCEPSEGQRTHAVLIGITTPDTDAGDWYGTAASFSVLEGAANDVKLLEGALQSLGVQAANIQVLLDRAATRETVHAAFLRTLRDVACGDRVFVSFSGEGGSLSDILLSEGAARDRITELYRAYQDFVEDVTYEEFPRRLVADIHYEDEAREEFRRMLDAADDNTFMILNQGGGSGLDQFVLGSDISDYVVALRNRGAHPVVVVDTGHAARANIASRQREAGDAGNWRYQFSASTVDRPGPRLLPAHGEFAVFYAARANEASMERSLQASFFGDGTEEGEKRFGELSFVVGEALLAAGPVTPRKIAMHIQERFGDFARSAGPPVNTSHPVIETSDADLIIVPESLERTDGPNPIRITSPSPKRGAMIVERPRIELKGVVDWTSPVLGVFVNNQRALLDGKGGFSRDLRAAPGTNTVTVTAVTADARLHSLTLEFVYAAEENQLQGTGQRYAIIIANQQYDIQTGFPSLSTPVSDANALSALLTQRFGFTTEIVTEAGVTQPLLLVDPTKREIQLALHHVGRLVGEQDTVLVYYAGHGVFEPVTQSAFWVPSDAESGFAPSFLSAADISAAIQRMQAGNIILISDSCYSGGLMRGGPMDEDKLGEDDRNEALLRLQARRSRVLITSGNNEPVDDLGGDGHSVFARALLDGLRNMRHNAFTARELFDGYVLQRVAANADQEPQFRPLEKVGHEGGDFVFVRAEKGDAMAVAAD